MGQPATRRTAAGRRKAWTVHLRDLGRDLAEQTAGDKAPLKVDREKGIIFGVKVLGRYSKNTHDVDGVTGTEYTAKARRQACQLYEGMTVRINHPDRKNPTANRDVWDTFGQLRNCREDGDDVRADLHYLKAHDLAESVCEDVERALGVYGLSHNARAGKECVRDGRLVIEELELVRSVDLVDKPATNRNLWESHVPAAKTTTLRELIEECLPKLSAARKPWAEHLLEDDGPAIDAPVESPPTDPDEAMRAAFEQSGMAILQQILAGDLDPKEGLAKLKDLVTTHGKLTAKEEPKDKPADVKEGDEGDGKPKDKTESTDTKTAERLAQLERKDACRDLCESLGLVPTKDQLADLMEIPTAPARKRVAEAYKAAAGKAPSGRGGPRSVSPGRNVSESQAGGRGAAKPTTTKGLLNRFR